MANDAQFIAPWAMPLDIGKGHKIDPVDARNAFGALLTPAARDGYGHASGVFADGQTGAGLSNALLTLGGSAGMSVTVNSGVLAHARSLTAGPYIGGITGAVTRSIAAANASSPRRDLVVFRFYEPTVDGGIGTLDKTADIVVLTGTPAGSPVVPSNLVRSADFILAEVLVRAGVTTIETADITPRRTFIAARGAIKLKPVGDTAAGAHEGEYADDIGINALVRWSGTEWEPIASPAAWQQFTPGLWSSAGQCNLGSGSIARGSYQRLGKTLRVRYYFRAVRPCNLGYGALYTRLPAGFYTARTEAGLGAASGRCQLNTQPPGGAYLQWIGQANMFADSNLVYPLFNKTITDNTVDSWRVATSAGQAGTGVPLLAGEFPDPLRGISIDLEAEIQ